MPRVANIPSEVAITAQQRDEAEEELREQQKTIDYNTLEYPIEILIEKYIDGLDDDTNELFIPDYQREMAWDNIRQSKFIESILLGLPIQYILVADITEDNNSRLEIIDGTQRIRTLARFINNELKLEALEQLKKFNNFRFDDLSLPRQRRFKRSTIRIVQLIHKTDEDIRRDMFQRLNNGSVKTNRNDLNPCAKSFTEVGRDKTADELLAIESRVVKYLRQILQNIEAYLENQEYLAAEYRSSQ
jgi:Protein of unknown function DUF262